MPLSNWSFGDMFQSFLLEYRSCATINAVGLIRWCHYMGEIWCWLPISNKVSFYFVFVMLTNVCASAYSFCASACSGHDCGVFVMVFMDLLCINGGVLCFSQTDMRQLREKCLADLLAGEIRNFSIMSPWLPCGDEILYLHISPPPQL